MLLIGTTNPVTGLLSNRLMPCLAYSAVFGTNLSSDRPQDIAKETVVDGGGFEPP